ncbi:glycosyltransferase family 4 protein [Prosthecochloris sp.]|uniref:glycosyltransferase family 4 protein n=1 Tax=Prosthecochloris sp. TaxID=290513 RepID=UPI0025FC9ACA|nr:glycosyltransferase family 4 protein [Prosthecochloris sp.]
MKPLRIAQIAPLIESVPPAKYGGTERVVYSLTEELVGRGHDVTLFATGDSRTSAKLCSLVERGLRLDGKQSASVVSSLLELAHVYHEMSHEFDIIHSHVDIFTLPFAATSMIPTVLTLHGRLDMPFLIRMLQIYTDMNYVSISNAQRFPVPNVNWAGTVYHGYPPECFPFNESPSDYFLYLGRFSPEKAPDQAIRLAKACGIPLKIAAKVDPVEADYFNEHIRPMLDDPLIEYVGEVMESDKIKLLKNAKALLNTIDWPEPFGLVMIEALACGTPVIVRGCGSSPEIIKHGKTGYVCSTEDDFKQAVNDIEKIKRKACRNDFEKRFSHKTMVDGYEKIYFRLHQSRTRQRVLPLPRRMVSSG